MIKRRPISEFLAKITGQPIIYPFLTEEEEGSSSLPPRGRSFQYDIALVGFDCSRRTRTTESVIGGAFRPSRLIRRVRWTRRELRRVRPVRSSPPVRPTVVSGHRARTRTTRGTAPGSGAVVASRRHGSTSPSRFLPPPSLPDGDALADRSRSTSVAVRWSLRRCWSPRQVLVSATLTSLCHKMVRLLLPLPPRKKIILAGRTEMRTDNCASRSGTRTAIVRPFAMSRIC